jgi:mannose/cellobiose epimerase-like protein (N-acyl-D-glucosamine 2-epimerase family)
MLAALDAIDEEERKEKQRKIAESFIPYFRSAERKIILELPDGDWEVCPDEDMPKVFEDSRCKHGRNLMLCESCK